MSYLVLRLPLPARYSGAWAAAQLSIKASKTADLDPGFTLVIVPSSIDMDELRGGVPNSVHAEITAIVQQQTTQGDAVVAILGGTAAELWTDMQQDSTIPLDSQPCILIANGLFEDITGVERMLVGKTIIFDELEAISLDTGLVVAQYSLESPDDNDDDSE